MKIFQTLLIIILFGISTSFADYQRNIDDEYKIYQFEEKIGERLSKIEDAVEIKENLKNYIFEQTGKTENEISKIGSIFQYDLKNFKEYILIKLYRFLDYGDGIEELKILENSYIKTIARSGKLNIDNQTVYGLYQEGTKRSDYIYFFPVSKNKDILEYINENIFEEKYKGKCEFLEYTGNFIFTDNIVFSFQPTEEYSEGFGFKETPDCGEFTHGYFERKSDDLIIFVKFTYEYVGLDFSLIEVK